MGKTEKNHEVLSQWSIDNFYQESIRIVGVAIDKLDTAIHRMFRDVRNTQAEARTQIELFLDQLAFDKGLHWSNPRDRKRIAQYIIGHCERVEALKRRKEEGEWAEREDDFDPLGGSMRDHPL